MKVFCPFLSVLMLLVGQSDLKGQGDNIVACKLDLISENKPPNAIRSGLWENIYLWWQIGMHSTSLWSKSEIIQGWGEEIATHTKGKGWVTKELVAKIKKVYDVELSDGALKQLIVVGTEPIANLSAIEALRIISQHHRIIVFGNQDRLEYETYQPKMNKQMEKIAKQTDKTKQKVNLNDIFSAVVVLRSYEDPESKFNPVGYLKYKPSPPWYLTTQPYPSKPFNAAILAAARNLGHEGNDIGTIPVIDTEKALKSLAYPST